MNSEDKFNQDPERFTKSPAFEAWERLSPGPAKRYSEAAKRFKDNPFGSQRYDDPLLEAYDRQLREELGGDPEIKDCKDVLLENLKPGEGEAFTKDFEERYRDEVLGRESLPPDREALQKYEDQVAPEVTERNIERAIAVLAVNRNSLTENQRDLLYGLICL